MDRVRDGLKLLYIFNNDDKIQRVIFSDGVNWFYAEFEQFFYRAEIKAKHRYEFQIVDFEFVKKFISNQQAPVLEWEGQGELSKRLKIYNEWYVRTDKLTPILRKNKPEFFTALKNVVPEKVENEKQFLSVWE